MLKISIRSALRLVALLVALACGWIAIATEQKARVPICVSGITMGPSAPAPCRVFKQSARALLPIRVGTDWHTGPTVAMSFAIIAALGFGLLAISPRQGSPLAYRWRRGVY